MKKNVKILAILLIALTLLLAICNVAFAIEPTQITPDEQDATKFLTLGNRIFGGIRIFGTIASVIILAVLGIKYITSSPEGKADYKANMVPYLVGAVLLFGATNVADMVYRALQGI